MSLWLPFLDRLATCENIREVLGVLYMVEAPTAKDLLKRLVLDAMGPRVGCEADFLVWHLYTDVGQGLFTESSLVAVR